MAALPADIAAASRDAIKVTVSDATILSRFPRARDGNAAPAAGYFDDDADALTSLIARQALIGVQGRRRFAVDIADVVLPDLSGALPSWTLVDAEQAVNGALLVARLEVDFESETTSLELFG